MSNSDIKELYADDSLASSLASIVDDVFYDAKIAQLESLLSVARFEGFTTANQFLEQIYADVKLLNKLKLESHANQYEADAKADHFTSEQF